MTDNSSSDPFRFAEVERSSSVAPARYLLTEDGIHLAYREYVSENPHGIIVMYHGGGAHSAAGYQVPARLLAEEYGYVVLTPDLRGHGLSEGRRGDARSTSTVFRDVDALIFDARSRYPDLPFALIGHSSGAGLLVNWAAHSQAAKMITAYGLLAPHLGFRSGTGRPNAAFSNAVIWPFALNAVSFGLAFRHYPAVKFSYPRRIVERDPLLVTSISVATANAVTPINPRHHLHLLEPEAAIWIGAEDELFDPQSLARFVGENASDIDLTVVSGATHLGILEAAARPLGEWLDAHLGQAR